jgi:hypothetical protein
MHISEFCIRRPVFATVLSLMLVIFGLVSLERLAVREYPDITRPVVSINTVYRGASANVVENKITQVIEDRVAGLEGVIKLESDSADERSSIRIEFDVSRDIDAAANDVRDGEGAGRERLAVDPDTHRCTPRAGNGGTRYAGDGGEAIDEVALYVVGDLKLRHLVGIEAEEHHRLAVGIGLGDLRCISLGGQLGDHAPDAVADIVGGRVDIA